MSKIECFEWGTVGRMSVSGFPVPIVVCAFNRPGELRQTLASISEVRPSRLFVVADGPRPHVASDAESCRQVRQVLDQAVDWPTAISWNIAPTNLGCRRRIQSGLDWVFDQVDRAIIIEDDCVPHPSFFGYCASLLDRYAEDPRIATISGTTTFTDADADAGSYTFSRYPLVWGWATWARTWRTYDPNLATWPFLRDTGWLERVLDDPWAIAFWRVVFDKVRAGADAWDYQLTFSCWRAGALSIHPRSNLVANIGFGPDATHTRDLPVHGTLPATGIDLPLEYPIDVVRNSRRDSAIQRLVYGGTVQDVFARARDHLAESRRNA